MRSVTWWLCLVTAVAGLMFASHAIARAEEGEGDGGERHEQMQSPGQGEAPAFRPMMGPQPGPQVRTVRVAFTPGIENTIWRSLRLLKCVGWTLAAIHVLLASWVFIDIRKRGDGHGIFVALALLGGLPATILYALVRLGDMKKS